MILGRPHEPPIADPVGLLAATNVCGIGRRLLRRAERGGFLARVGNEYPHPRINEGRRRLWLRDDLDKAILPSDLAGERDAAEDL